MADDRIEMRPVQELAYGATQKVPQLNVTISLSAEATNTITATIQAYQWNDTYSDTIPLEIWIGTTSKGAADATGNTFAVSTGTLINSYTANAHIKVLTDSTGKAVVTATIAGNATRYLMVEIAGTLFVSSVLTFTA